MDVTFRESEPYYRNPLEKTSPARREGERLVIRGEISLDGAGGECAAGGFDAPVEQATVERTAEAGGVDAPVEQAVVERTAKVEQAAVEE